MLRGPDQEATERIDQSLVGLVYDGLLEPRPWSTLLETLRLRMRASACSLLLQPRGSLLPVTSFRSGGSDEGTAAYRERFHLLDPFVGLPERRAVTLDEFVDQDTLRTGDFHRNFLAPFQSDHVLGIDFSLDTGVAVRFRVARPATLPDFDRSERTLCLDLVPHLERALKIFMRLDTAETARALYEAAVEQLSIGAIVVSPDGQILRTNPIAAAILDEADGLRCVAGRIVTDERAATSTLAELLRAVASRCDGPPALVAPPIRIERGSGRAPLGIFVRPGPALADAAFVNSALILITDPDRRETGAPETIAALLGVTRAEAALAVLLTQGLSLYGAAEILGVRRTTVRAQLRSIFAKTGINRQSDLVRVVLRHAMALPPG
jgi:DNA-binding CsgD family transcriptional regulator/PAS domain-containing protein